MPISSTHWGTFEATARSDGGLDITPFARDAAPSELLDGLSQYRTHAARILRPAVRKGWLEGRAGIPAPGRGADPFVEVDWDTALDLVARELERVRRTRGNDHIFAGSYGWSSAGRFHHAKTQLKRFINAIGGGVEQRNNYSFGAGMVLLPHVLGSNEMLYGPVTGWDAILEGCDLFVSFGGLPSRNGQIESGGVGSHVQGGYRKAFVARGGRIVNISPLGSDVDDTRSEWLAVRPGTDTALMLALCHTLLSEDLADHAFLARCTTGAEVFLDYLRQGNGGGPFDADWAARICDLPAGTIRALARRMAASRCFINLNWSLQRAEFGEQCFWAGIALAALLGQIGLRGRGLGFGFGSMAGSGNPVARLSSPAMPVLDNPLNRYIPVARVTDYLLGEVTDMAYDGQRLTLPAPTLVYWAGGNPFHHHQDINRLLEGWARPETIIVHDHVWTATARHADIVLPATMGVERDDIATSSNDRYVIAMRKVAEPPGQARDDYAIFADLAARLGVAETYTEGRDAAAWIAHLYDETRTKAARRGVEMPDFAAWRDKGFFEKPLSATPFTSFEAFRADPEGAPLATPSGRIELYSQAIADFGYPDCPGHPSWLPPREGLTAPRARRFPLHLLSTQPKHRLHGQLDPVGGSKASKIRGREPLVMHPEAAAARGVKAGDVVRVWNDRGACLAGVTLNAAMRADVVQMATGAWYDPLLPGQPGCLDLHGNPNVLTHDRPTSALSQGPAAQSCLVEVEPWRSQVPPIRVHDAPAFAVGRVKTKPPAETRAKRAASPDPTGDQP
ncbi:molybdopterin-dependent oxidoreductase [Pseudooceanicola sp. CBS1P-1]|uniref:molybdopterin-dependent oxidoreductase n=1 Tax=Pseudooceanicola TaxID=1679449 RepID=UPI001928B720|nr:MULTISPECIES: molybdopterin-dependent oxidoreductase [Pseudooceanicola]MBT9385435.1 molybdopterin-dependent oxidoreductase [Pseudooceanicola endophyticus]